MSMTPGKMKLDADWRKCPHCHGTGARVHCIIERGLPTRRVFGQCVDCYGSGRAGAVRVVFECVDVLLFETPSGFQFGIPVNTFANFDQGANFIQRLANALGQAPVPE